MQQTLINHVDAEELKSIIRLSLFPRIFLLLLEPLCFLFLRWWFGVRFLFRLLVQLCQCGSNCHEHRRYKANVFLLRFEVFPRSCNFPHEKDCKNGNWDKPSMRTKLCHGVAMIQILEGLTTKKHTLTRLLQFVSCLVVVSPCVLYPFRRFHQQIVCF